MKLTMWNIIGTIIILSLAIILKNGLAIVSSISGACGWLVVLIMEVDDV